MLENEDSQNSQEMNEQLQKLAQVANSIILQTANQVGLTIPDIQGIYNRNKLLVNNEDVLSLLKYSSFLHQMLISHLITRIIEDIRTKSDVPEIISDEDLEVEPNEKKPEIENL